MDLGQTGTQFSTSKENIETTLDFFCSSEEWNALTEEQKQALDLTVTNDGEFWLVVVKKSHDVLIFFFSERIPVSDWLDNFHTVQICHMTPDTVVGGGVRNQVMTYTCV
jgi:hypothetical protein